MMRVFAGALAALLAASIGAQAAPACRDAKGHFIKCPAPAAAVAATSAARPASATVARAPASAGLAAVSGPNCKVGKRCGASCIPKDKVCHKS